MGFLTWYGGKHGDMEKLLAPLDGDKNFCGYSAGFEKYDKLYISDFSNSLDFDAIFDSAICVSECPKEDTLVVDCKTTSHVKACAFRKDQRYDSKPSGMGFCVPVSIDALPDNFKEGWRNAMDVFQQSSVGRYFNDMYLSSRAIYWSMAMAFVYCFIYIYLMSAFAEPIAWICVGLIQLGLIGASVACFFIRKHLIQNNPDAEENLGSGDPSNWSTNQSLNSDIIKNEKMYLAGCIFFAIAALIFFCLICCGFRSLKLAIDVIDASADFLAGTKRIILVPIFYFFLTLIVVLIWSGGMAAVVSMNEIEAGDGIQEKDLTWKKNVVYMALYMLFGILWITAWLEYTSTFVVMVSASTYYFNSGPNNEGAAEVSEGFKMAYLYHCGSIACGAFVIAIIRFIRIVFYYLAKQAEKASGDNQAVKLIVSCANCILNCIEKFVDYINESAFAYMAVSGDSFCSSSWNGFLLNVKHLLKFQFANTIAKVFIFLGKIAIVVGNCFSLYFIMDKITHDTEEVSSLLGPMVVVAIVSYITASIFLGLFDTAVLALMTCLAVDMDMNDGHPQFGPPTFHDSIEKIDQGRQGNYTVQEAADMEE
uniref:Choline transporter-like protein n=1 Tax=Strombidium inclinatum TaxID=197538 RepID=A0A7S3N2V9_9SPIT|mmetsp:Transcript_5178/g.7988  ORF Transcript_5178/g.7988 Transcript_5178/m.7988 type:complete len:593 (+) Transcript_5178:193-1971(+)